jgi:hypothetical protein
MFGDDSFGGKAVVQIGVGETIALDDKQLNRRPVPYQPCDSTIFPALANLRHH